MTAKAQVKKNNLVSGTTKSGFKYEVNPKVIRDYRFVRLLAKIAEDGTVFDQAMNKLLGEEQVEKLLSFHEDEDGLVDTELVALDFSQIITDNPPIKNS